MMYYSQSKGSFTLGGRTIGYGYAGNGLFKNDPNAQGNKGHGPLPRGLYHLTGFTNHHATGPFTIDLEPDKCNDMCGRSEFRIHGDSLTHPGCASDGCIVLAPNLRHLIWDSGERELTVTQ